MVHSRACPKCGSLADWDFVPVMITLPTGEVVEARGPRVKGKGLKCPKCGHEFRNAGEEIALGRLNRASKAAV